MVDFYRPNHILYGTTKYSTVNKIHNTYIVNITQQTKNIITPKKTNRAEFTSSSVNIIYDIHGTLCWQ